MNLTVKINTVDKTSLIDWHTFTINDNIDSQPNLCRFTIKTYDSQTFKPTAGDTIEVTDGATKIFAGTIIKVTSSQNGDLIEYKALCKDETLLLDRIFITERFENMTAAAIISSIVSTNLSGQGVTTNNVVATTTIDTIAFVGVTISQALKDLAKLLNYSWYIDYDKDIHFFAKTIEISPFDLTDSGNNHIDNSFVLVDDISQLRNRVSIRGGEKTATNTRTKTHVYDGTNDERSFPTDYKFATIPTVKVNTVTKTIGLENIDDDASFDFMWDFNQKTVRATSTITLVDADVIDITGNPLIPIFVQVEDVASINSLGGDPDGVYELEKTDKRIASTEEARQFADAQIEAYANQIHEAFFRTYTSGLISGQTITINLTNRGINDKFLIQKVVLKMFSPTNGEWLVTLATFKTIGIINFLQELLTNEKIELNEDEVLEKFFNDSQNIQITEEISLKTKMEDFQSINITESITKDPFGANTSPDFVLGPYTPTSDTDPKRVFKVDRSYIQ